MTDEQTPTPESTEPELPTSPIEEAVADATTPQSERWVTASPGAEKPRRPVEPLLITTVVFAIVAVLLALMVFAPRMAPLKLGATKLAANAQEEQAIVDAAKRFSKSFVTIDYRTIDADFRRMQADATGGFKDRLTETKNLIKGPFKTAKAHSAGKALDAAVISHEKDSAVVQVLLQRTKSNKSLKQSQSCNQVVNVSLTKTGDGWKIDNLSELGSPTCK